MYVCAPTESYIIPFSGGVWGVVYVQIKAFVPTQSSIKGKSLVNCAHAQKNTWAAHRASCPSPPTPTTPVFHRMDPWHVDDNVFYTNTDTNEWRNLSAKTLRTLSVQWWCHRAGAHPRSELLPGRRHFFSSHVWDVWHGCGGPIPRHMWTYATVS